MSVLKKHHSDSQEKIKRLKALHVKYRMMLDVASAYSVVIPIAVSPSGLMYDIDRLRYWDEMVEDGRLGLRPIGENDFELLAPQGTNSDVMQSLKYPTLSGLGLTFIFWGAVVLLASVGAYVAKLWYDIDAAENQIENLTKVGNEALCQDPNSPQCIEWRKAQLSYEYKKNQSVIDRMGGVFEVGFAGIGKILVVGVLAVVAMKFFEAKYEKK
jgi:hypothetical protein